MFLASGSNAVSATFEVSEPVDLETVSEQKQFNKDIATLLKVDEKDIACFTADGK